MFPACHFPTRSMSRMNAVPITEIHDRTADLILTDLVDRGVR